MQDIGKCWCSLDKNSTIKYRENTWIMGSQWLYRDVQLRITICFAKKYSFHVGHFMKKKQPIRSSLSVTSFRKHKKITSFTLIGLLPFGCTLNSGLPNLDCPSTILMINSFINLAHWFSTLWEDIAPAKQYIRLD